MLDIGAGVGAGRFTRIRATLGASIAGADISSVQLALNKTLAAEYGFADSITEWSVVDICNLSRYADASFDAVAWYGWPLS